MNTLHLKDIVFKISEIITENRKYLIELDQKNGDGDLGISMDLGFKAIASYMGSNTEKDLGQIFMLCSSKFNEAAPSSLGTILSIGMMGMAKELMSKEEVTIYEFGIAMEKGIHRIMDKAKSKVGEKTILDALCPAIEVLKRNDEEETLLILRKAYIAAINGSESTKEMRSVHGRAAYYGDKSIGILDGGSVVGKIIFQGAYEYYCNKFGYGANIFDVK